VSYAIIGFTCTSFAISFAFPVLSKAGNPKSSPLPPSNKKKELVILGAAFAIYLVLLLSFAGLIALPKPNSIGSSGSPNRTPILEIYTHTSQTQCA
jgi:hypothetical protein